MKSVIVTIRKKRFTIKLYQGEMNFAGMPGFEPGKAVLETAVIPFHHIPI